MIEKSWLTTAQAAAFLAERGVLVTGRTGTRPPTARTVEQWCRKGVLPAWHVGGDKQGGSWLIDQAVLETFNPPLMGRKPKSPDSSS